jgi:hypothetical protein
MDHVAPDVSGAAGNEDRHDVARNPDTPGT